MRGSRVRWVTWKVAVLAQICFAAAMFAQPEFKVLHSFDGTDGNGPYALLHASADGFLYGTANAGGKDSSGTLFRMDADGKHFQVLHTFTGEDGKSILASLVEPIPPDGYVYGTACAGGAEDAGTVFRVRAVGTDFQVLHDFSAPTDGGSPCSALAPGLDGRLYGTASQGGAHGFGTIFILDTDGSDFDVILDCALEDCASPSWGVVQGSDGLLYGTRYNNVMLPTASVFRLATDGSAFQTIYPGFTSYPTALMQGSDGYLYGAVQESMFRMDTSGGNFLARFGVGVNAVSEGADGRIYGSNVGGGQHLSGTIFRLNYGEDSLPEVIHDCAQDAWAPTSPPIQGADGAMYGATPRGGNHDLGAVYRLTLVPVYVITPTSGPAAGGTSVEVYVWNIHDDSTLRMGGEVPAAVVANEATRTITATAPALAPGTLNDVQVLNADGTFGTARRMWFADFLDVPVNFPHHFWIERVFRNAITAGCGGGNYCPSDELTRAQMAVLLLKAKHGAEFQPPPCEGLFPDVSCGPTPSFAADWIEELYREGITGGCGGGGYCPNQPVTRAQMAVFLLKAVHGAAFSPPACEGIFQDVLCAPTPAFAVEWIEELSREGIALGCSSNPRNYCPDGAVKRGQMAVFVVNAFALQP